MLPACMFVDSPLSLMCVGVSSLCVRCAVGPIPEGRGVMAFSVVRGGHRGCFYHSLALHVVFCTLNKNNDIKIKIKIKIKKNKKEKKKRKKKA